MQRKYFDGWIPNGIKPAKQQYRQTKQPKMRAGKFWKHKKMITTTKEKNNEELQQNEQETKQMNIYKIYK